MALCRAVCSLVTFSALAFAQAQISSGDLSGVVSDPSGASISQARVTIADPVRGISRNAVTGTDGKFQVVLLPPGVYRVRVEAAGFATKVIENLEIRVGDSVALPVQLTVSGMSTEILVTAEPQVLDTERTQQSTTLQPQQIRNLPINRRNYLDFALLSPGVVETNDLVDGTDYRVAQAPHSGLSFGGSNGRGNSFSIDGIANYASSGGVRPSVSQEAVGEFQVNRSSFSAEFGGGLGGAINIVSKSGTNDWHGNFFGFIRHRNIQARNYFDPGKSAFTRQQSGVTLGGPVRKDKTFLFFAFERLDRNETSFVPILQDRSAFSSLTQSQRQLSDFFNASGVPQFRQLAGAMQQNLITNNFPRTVALFNDNSGNFPFHENSTQGSVRLDHRFDDNRQFFLRGNIAQTANQNAATGALIGYNRGRDFDERNGTIVAGYTHVLRPNFVSETRVGFGHYMLDVTTIDRNGPQIDINGFGLFGREIFLPAKSIERHYQAMQNFTHMTARHTLKFGADINPVRSTVVSETFFSGRFSFGENVPLGQLFNAVTGDPNFSASLGLTLVQLGQQKLIPSLSAPITGLQAYNLGYPTYYQQGFGDPNWMGWAKRYNFFVTDTWKLHQRLTLNIGARYELEVNKKIVGTDPNNIAPRIGLAWNATSDMKTIVRAGFGMYYSQINAMVPNISETLAGQQIAQVFVPLTGAPGLLNPLTGKPLTSADIYQRLLGQGVIGRRPILSSDLLQFGVKPAPTNPFAVIFGIVPDFVNPYAHQASFEVERAIGSFAVSAAYNFNRGAHIVRILDRNLFYGPTAPNGQPTFGFYNPLIFQKNIFESTANSFYHAMVLQMTKRFSRGIALNAHYTWSKAIDETLDFNTDFEPHDQLNARGDRALSTFNQKRRFVASGVIETSRKLGGVVLSPVFVANSGRPFNLLTGVDNLGDRHPNDHRPLRAGRNIGQGPDYFTVDMRVSRKFYLGKESRNLEFIAEGFNLLNRTNFKSINNAIGNVTVEDLPKSLTGVRGNPMNPFSFTSAFDARQFQLGLKFNY